MCSMQTTRFRFLSSVPNIQRTTSSYRHERKIRQWGCRGIWDSKEFITVFVFLKNAACRCRNCSIKPPIRIKQMVFGICAFYLSSLKLIFTHRSQLLHPQTFITKPHKWLNVAAFSLIKQHSDKLLCSLEVSAFLSLRTSRPSGHVPGVLIQGPCTAEFTGPAH